MAVFSEFVGLVVAPAVSRYRGWLGSSHNGVAVAVFNSACSGNPSHHHAVCEALDAILQDWKGLFCQQFGKHGVSVQLAACSAIAYCTTVSGVEVTISPAFELSKGLLEVAAGSTAEAVVDEAVYKTVQFAFLTRPIEVVSWPTHTQATARVVVYEFCGRKQLPEAEWMYAILHQNASDEFAEWRRMFSLLMTGELEVAAGLLRAHLEVKPLDRIARWLEKVLESGVPPLPADGELSSSPMPWLTPRGNLLLNSGSPTISQASGPSTHAPPT
eukprot:RCo043292